jgi:hypothetical protein
MSEERSNIGVQNFARIDVSSSRMQMNFAMAESKISRKGKGKNGKVTGVQEDSSHSL